VHALPKTIVIFIFQKGITNLNEACEEAQILEKYLKKCPLTLTHFLDSNDINHDKEKSLE